MQQIIVILLVAYILIPLADIILNERVRFAVKIFLYVLSAVWIIWTTFFIRTV